MVVLHPYFKWGQDFENVYMEIDLVGVRDEKVAITSTDLSWSGYVGDQLYRLQFEFFGPVDDHRSKHETCRSPTFVFAKRIEPASERADCLEQKDKENKGQNKKSWWLRLLHDKTLYKGRCGMDVNKWFDPCKGHHCPQNEEEDEEDDACTLLKRASNSRVTMRTVEWMLEWI